MFKKEEYINSETCEKCPHRNDKRGCPRWVDATWGLMETNVATGEERMITGCMYPILFRWMKHVVTANNRDAAAIESTRNEIAKGFGNVVQAVIQLEQKTLTQIEKK